MKFLRRFSYIADLKSIASFFRVDKYCSNFIKNIITAVYINTGKIKGINGIANILNPINLQVFSLYGEFPGNPFIQFINLIELNLSKNNVTDEALENISKFTQLIRLNINGCPNIKNISYLSGLTNIRVFGLNSLEIKDDGLKHISKFTYLKSLSLNSCRYITNKAIENISNLTDLNISNTFSGLIGCEGNEGLRFISGLINLTKIDMTNCNCITDKQIRHISALVKIKMLFIGGTEVTSDGLESISSFTNLIVLNLYGTEVGNSGLQHISYFKNLTSLNIANCEKITNKGISYISGLSSLNIIRK